MLECVTQEFASIAENLWNKYSKLVNITKYKKSVRMAKRIFFDNRIQEIASTNKRP